MTVDVSGLQAAQARVGQIQAMFGQPLAAAAATAPATTTTGSFGAAMAKARTETGAQTSSNSTSTPSRAAVPAKTAKATTLLQAAVKTMHAASSTARSTAVDSDATGLKNADAVLATAKRYLGIPYKWGGTNPNVGLDCSGFVQLVMKQHGVSLPRVSRDQARMGTRVDSIKDALPGDLVAFGSPVHHIGIYVGDGKMIHAPKTGDVVKISKVHKDLTAIRRVLPQDAGVASLATPAPAAAQPSATKPSSNTTPTATPAASPLPAAGVDTQKLASTVRNAALRAAVQPDPTTYREAVAAAVTQSLAGENPSDVQATVSTVMQGLGTVTPAMLSAIDQAKNAQAVAATAAAPQVANPNRLAPDAVGTGPLNEAPAQYRALFQAAERKYGVPATLLAAVAKQESDFTATARSHAGAQGLMQLMPGTARGLGVNDPFDPAQAIDGAARLLRSNLRQFGSTELALAAYNAGGGAVKKYNGIPPYAETQNYVRKIMAGLKGRAA